MSYSFRGKDTFTAIPGLLHWIDGRYNVQTRSHINGYDLVTSWGDLSSNAMLFNGSSQARQPIYTNEGYVLFSPDLTSAPSHQIVETNKSRITKYRNLWYRPSKWGIYIIANDTTGQIANSPAFFSVLLTSTAGGGNFMNLYHDRQALGDPDSRFYLLRRVDGVNGAIQSGYTSQWQNTISSFSHFVTDESVGNTRFYSNNVLKHTGTITVTPPSVIPDEVLTVTPADVSASSGTLRLYTHIVYDWTDYTLGEALNFDQRVRILLEEKKEEFLAL